MATCADATNPLRRYIIEYGSKPKPMTAQILQESGQTGLGPIHHSTIGTHANGATRFYLPDAELAEALVVTQHNHFVGHGSTDAQPILNLQGTDRRQSLQFPRPI